MRLVYTVALSRGVRGDLQRLSSSNKRFGYTITL
jgi:hypothetical protein